jgi:hypothetical protein
MKTSGQNRSTLQYVLKSLFDARNALHAFDAAEGFSSVTEV